MKYLKVLPLLCFVLLFALVCGTARKKQDKLKVEFRRIDHFIVGIYEVGALKYQPYILPEGKILLYDFPVYVGGEKVRDIQVNLYGIPEDFVAFSREKISEEKLKRMSLLWLLEERTKNKPYQVLRRYAGTPTYEQIKKDVIEILGQE